MDISEESLALHYKLRGKLEVVSRYPIQTQKDLSLAYTPGVAAPCLEIQKDPAKSFQLTRRQNLVAVITDGSAVLGLGNIGPLAGMPVMEGKCVLFKEFAGTRWWKPSPGSPKASGASTWRTSPPPGASRWSAS